MYTRFYNLHRRPFENAPDPSILYLSKQHREVLYSLVYGIEEARGFVLLAGDVGTGKTTLVRALLKELDGKHVVIGVVNPHVGFDDIFAHLLLRLGLKEYGPISLAALEALKEKLTLIDEQGQRVVLLIDEAHLLSEETLEGIRLLSNIENDQAKLIQIVLVGQNEVYALLNKGSQKSLQQRIVVNRQLTPLAWTEARGYITHRLAESGCGAELFDGQAMALIWRASGGIPRVINQICDNALMTGYAVEEKVIGRKIIREVLHDMEPMRSKGWLQCLRQPISAWPPWSIAALCLLLFLGLGVAGINRPDQARHPLTSPPLGVAIPQTEVVTTEAAAAAPVRDERVAGGNSHPASGSLLSSSPVPSLVPSGLSLRTVLDRPGTGVQTMPHNESLWTMTEKIYGGVSETLLDLIQMANEGLDDINQVHYGQTLVFPTISRESMLGPGADGKLHIHYASFYDEENAQRAKEKLQKVGLDAFVVAASQGIIQVFRVYVGSFMRKEDAVAVLNTVDFKNLPFLNGTEKEKRYYAN